MTKAEYLTHNMKIALFLGGTIDQAWSIKDKSGEKVEYAWRGKIVAQVRAAVGMPDLKGTIDAILCSQLQFHSDPRWLIPVLDKILEIRNQADEELFNAIEEDTPDIFNTSILCPWDAVYQRIVEFVDWYNGIEK